MSHQDDKWVITNALAALLAFVATFLASLPVADSVEGVIASTVVWGILPAIAAFWAKGESKKRFIPAIVVCVVVVYVGYLGAGILPPPG